MAKSFNQVKCVMYAITVALQERSCKLDEMHEMTLYI